MKNLQPLMQNTGSLYLGRCVYDASGKLTGKYKSHSGVLVYTFRKTIHITLCYLNIS